MKKLLIFGTMLAFTLSVSPAMAAPSEASGSTDVGSFTTLNMIANQEGAVLTTMTGTELAAVEGKGRHRARFDFSQRNFAKQVGVNKCRKCYGVIQVNVGIIKQSSSVYITKVSKKKPRRCRWCR